MYYSMYDDELNCMLYTGRNSKSKEECVEDVFEFATMNTELEDSELKQITAKTEFMYEYLQTLGFRVVEHEEKEE